MLNRIQQRHSSTHLALALAAIFIALIACGESSTQNSLPQSTTTPDPTVTLSPKGRPPTQLTFVADKTTAAAGQTVTFTATTDQPVDSSGYVIEIDNTSTGSVRNSCSRGIVCTAQSANSDAQATYQAFVKNSGATLLSSNQITVMWAAPPQKQPTNTPIHPFPTPTNTPLVPFPTTTPPIPTLAPPR